MQFDEFMNRVIAEARLASTGEAVTATRATLETLGERLPDGAAENLAGQLPREVGLYLTRSPYENNFDLDAFYQRIKEKTGEGMGYPQAVYQAKSVMRVLGDAVGAGEIERVRRDLGANYDDLFERVCAA
ncbi:MAG: DUF2267 domain-containing protein [Verrucomicrobiota bacterium]